MSLPATTRGTDARGRRTLLLIALAVIAPVALSYATYYLFPRDSRVNYGELLPTQAVGPLAGTRDDGTPFRLDALRGRWVLVAAAGGACDASCENRLYAMRQARTMQGKDQDRVERVWLVTDDVVPGAARRAEHPGLVVVRVPSGAAAALPGGGRGVVLVDPLGHQVLAWPADPDIKALAKDLGRLLKASRIG